MSLLSLIHSYPTSLTLHLPHSPLTDSNCLYGSTRGSTSLSSRSSPSSSPPPPPPPLPLPLPDHIKELMEKGVQYIDYYNLTLEEELGSVSSKHLNQLE